LRVELSTLALQRSLASLRADDRLAGERVLQSLAAFYRQRLAGHVVSPPAELRDTLAAAIQRIETQAETGARHARAALIEMQVTLFGVPLSGKQVLGNQA